jgi:diadenosine tetraphosphate (Ap4A) HIT family hydrolase
MNVFSEKLVTERLFENEHFYILEDRFPVSPGQLLIVSKREVADYFSLNDVEQRALSELINEARKLIEQRILQEGISQKPPDGYNIGMNCGSAAGQTVMHFHCHVIPRYLGDTPNPRGGIRHCIPEKGDY